MKDIYCLTLFPSFPLDQAWNELEMISIEILYSSEEEGKNELYVQLHSPEEIKNFKWIEKIELSALPSINWNDQWETHGYQFKEGFVNVDFEKFGRQAPSLRLQPGAGFGDLSHPTTLLMLNLLATHHQNEIVIDIGCGSGVLTLAAVKLGSPLAYGIDIDQNALLHSHVNACLNQVEDQCVFCLPADFKLQETSQNLLILMNMISSEQQIAWSSLPLLHSQPTSIITSGIRLEEREKYLALTQKQGWVLQQEQKQDEWLAFYFTT